MYTLLVSRERNRDNMNSEIYTITAVEKFIGAEVAAACPLGGRLAVLGALKRLTEEGLIVKWTIIQMTGHY